MSAFHTVCASLLLSQPVSREMPSRKRPRYSGQSPTVAALAPRAAAGAAAKRGREIMAAFFWPKARDNFDAGFDAGFRALDFTAGLAATVSDEAAPDEVVSGAAASATATFSSAGAAADFSDEGLGADLGAGLADALLAETLLAESGVSDLATDVEGLSALGTGLKAALLACEASVALRPLLNTA